MRFWFCIIMTVFLAVVAKYGVLSEEDSGLVALGAFFSFMAALCPE